MPLTRLTPIPENQIDSLIARDSEVVKAVNSHQSEADPHPIYLTKAEGDQLYMKAWVWSPANVNGWRMHSESLIGEYYINRTITVNPKTWTSLGAGQAISLASGLYIPSLGRFPIIGLRQSDGLIFQGAFEPQSNLIRFNEAGSYYLNARGFMKMESFAE